MDYETALKTCSKEVQAAIRWLEEHVKFDREKLDSELKKEKGQVWVKDISRRLAAQYLCSDALCFYVFSKVSSPLLNDVLNAAKSEEFWLDDDGPEGFDDYFFYDPGLLWYLSKIGLKENECFKRALEVFIKKRQTREGRIPTGGEDRGHNRSSRILISVEPHSEATELAVRNFLNNLDKFLEELRRTDYFYLRSSLFKDLAIGVLALCELDYFKFKETIRDLGDFLKSEQKEEGYWNEIIELHDRTPLLPTEETSIVIEALSRVFGPNDECVIRAVEWLKKHQKEDGGWGSIDQTAYACLALMSVGEGPKVPHEEVEWKEMLTIQRLKHTKPYFLHTSPEYYEQRHIEDIQKTIKDMFHSAESEIRILSPYLELLHDELIKLLAEKPNLALRVITRPKEDLNPHNKKIIDLLNKHTKGNCKSNWKLHSRMVIVDNREVLVSSSDLDRNGLIDQYNAGIWTRDKEAVEEAIKFFENLWEESEGAERGRDKNL